MPAAASAEPIKIGLLAPLSGPGAQIGESAQVGVEYATKVINEGGGIGGRPIQLVIGDYQANPTVGVSEARRLIDREQVDLVIGPTYSQVTLAVMPLLIDADIASINVSGTDLLTPDAAPYSFSMLVNSKVQAELMTRDAKERLKASSVAILSDTGAQAKTAVVEIRAAVEASGMMLTGTQEYQYGASDMTPQLLDLKRGNPDALILFASTGDDTGHVLKGLREIGWKIGVSGSYGVALAGPGIAIAGKEAYENVVGINYRSWTSCGSGSLDPKMGTFIEGLRAFRPAAAERLPFNYVSLWYDGVFLLRQAVEANDGSTDGATLAKWIEQNSGNFDGINSGLNASADTHFLIGSTNLAMVHPAEIGDGGVQKRVDCE
ncbi:MAG: ABC transporter substrate-binding protein [Pseudaminobacter sp.]